MRTLPIAIACALTVAALLGGCGGGDTTTVIQQTTTTITDATAPTTTDESTTSSTTSSTTTTEDSGGTSPAVALKSFQSPSGNIGCMMSAQVVRCDIAEKQWAAPRPSSCPSEVDSGQGLTMQASGAAKVVCAGDTVLNPQAPKLAYGSSSQIGSITCTSTEADVECANSSGGTFKLSRESYELN